MDNTQEQYLQGIVISVDNLNRQVWGTIHHFIEYCYTNGEIKDFGLVIFGTDTRYENSNNIDSKQIVQFYPKNRICIRNANIRVNSKTVFGILYNKSDGHDDFEHIASFLMLEKKYSDKIVFGINLNDIEYSVAQDYKFRLAAFCCLSNNKPIRLLLKDTILNKQTGEVIQIDEQSIVRTEDVARTYLPLCRITNETYNQLFVKKVDGIEETTDWNEEENALILYLKKSIKKIEEDFNPSYLKIFNKRYTSLFDKWFILAYFYSIGNPYTDKRLKSETTGKTKYTDDDLVAALKTYTNNIQELSQNIINHTNNKKGYLYVAFIKKGDISRDILDNNSTLANISTDVKRFVEFGIMDSADKGIVTTFKERRENTSENIQLIDFFDLNPTRTINLTSLDMRYAAHLGLKTFVASIKGQGGYFYVESNDDNDKSRVELCNGEIRKILSHNFVNGTHFHVIVPVSKIEGLVPSPKSQISTESFIEQYNAILKDGKRIRVSDTDLSSILRLSNATDIEERNNEIKELGDRIAKEQYSIDEIKREIAIELSDYDGSLYIVQNVYRLINYLQLSLNNNYFTTIVLTNLSNEFIEAFWNLFDTHVIQAKLSPVWKTDCAIVLMSKHLDYIIVSGETKSDMDALNIEMRKHYCVSTDIISSGTATIKEELKYFVRPYELLINNNKHFYSYVDNLLRKCIEDKKQGYCVRHENTYIGSKMIVVNYYEAETLFQNSFYAERFAFLIAQKLKDNLKDKQIIINENMYIVGAGYYSDLMIKSVQRLFDDCKAKPKTMLATDDGDKINFHYSIKPNQESKFVIITPLGSTMSYNDKIAAFIMREFGVSKESMVHYSVIVVGNKNQYQDDNHPNDIYKFSNGSDTQKPDIEYTFRWESIDLKKKQIHLRYKNVEIVDYDILIGQKDKNDDNWHRRIDKNITFPKDYWDEKYVNLTENQSINSQNLLGFPKLHSNYLDSTKHEIELKNLTELMPYIYHGHIKYHHTHYRYYFYSEKFIAEERVKVNSNLVKWMVELKKDPIFQKSDGCLNIIITPNARIGSEFVNYINQEVFCNNAQIINIDANSWKNNMSHKYKYIGDIKKNNDVKFHYVDHALLTANTFLKTENFLKEIVEPRIGFDSVIVLINRVSPNLTDSIAIKGNFRSFLNLFIPESTDSISDCLLCALEDFYKRFHKKTISLDCKKIIEKNECKIKKTTFEKVKKEQVHIDEKKQLRLLFTHELFYRIANINNSSNDPVEKKYDLTSKMLDKFYTNEMNVICNEWYGKKSSQLDLKITFVKVISSPPLSRFIAVRQYACLKLLVILKCLLEKESETCNLDDFKLLKAVLKSLSFLNSTALVRKTVILGSWRMYNSVFNAEYNDLINANETNLFSQAKNELSLFPNEFHFNIKNSILEDETKSMFLNELLRTGEECLSMDELKENVKKQEGFQVMRDEGLKFCDKVKQQYEHFLEWLYYDTTTVLQKALDNFEKETIKDDDIKKSFYTDYEGDNPRKWILQDYPQTMTDKTIQDFRDKVEGEGNKVEYYYENLKLYNSNKDGIDYIDKLVRVLYAKLKLERLVDSETDNSQTRIEYDIKNLLNILMDIMDSQSAFIIFNQNEQAYYEFAVGKYNECGKLDKDKCKSIINDFSVSSPFEEKQITIQEENYRCVDTRIDDHGVLYFAYKKNGESSLPSKAQKQLLLLLKNNLCRYFKFIRNKGLLDVWVEKQQINEFFKERYKKNTHDLFEKLTIVSNTFFDSDEISEYHVNLYAILADLYVGKIHNSLLVNKKQVYECSPRDYDETDLNQFITCAKFYLNDNKIAMDGNDGTEKFIVGDLSGKTFYYNKDIHFILFQFVNNIVQNTKAGRGSEVVVNVYIEKDYLVIKNTHSTITNGRVAELRTKLKSDFHNEELTNSISLYCINHYFKQVIGKELYIDIEDNQTFVVKIPIVVNN